MKKLTFTVSITMEGDEARGFNEAAMLHAGKSGSVRNGATFSDDLATEKQLITFLRNEIQEGLYDIQGLEGSFNIEKLEVKES